jgi:hypothetical protein
MVSMLLVEEAMHDLECVFVKGAERFSNYVRASNSF